jgi:predicted RNase H-related nuclease YkuK (DUF458 family)
MVQIITDTPIENGQEFYSPTKGSLTIAEMISDISNFMDEDLTSFYTLIIGTDSQIKHSNGSTEVDFVTAVIVYRQKKGARYFFRKEKQHKKPILRDRIYTETLMSLDLAKVLVPQIHDRILPEKYDLEIHIDVGPNGPTREMIREVVGMVTGSGYVAKTKPESWGASSVADKHT